MFFFCFSFLVWLKRDGTQRTSSFHCSSHVSSVSEGGGESNGSRIYDKSSAETCRVVRRRICTETGKVGKKKTDIYIFLYLLSFPLFFLVAAKKKKRDDEHAGFLFLIMQGTSLLCFLIFFVCTTRKSIKKNGKRLIIYTCASLPRNTRYATQPVFFFFRHRLPTFLLPFLFQSSTGGSCVDIDFC